MPEDPYVTRSSWMSAPGRADAIDEVADQFERPSGASAFWDDVTARRLARASTLTPRARERRAG